MFLKQLFEAALAHVALGENPTPEARALHLMVNNQIALVDLAFKELKSVRTDIEALRLDGGNFFQGTGGCEWGHEDCSVTLEWPNLAIMSDTIAELLKTAESAGQMTPIWYVLYGTEGEFFKAAADDREHAMEQCQNAYPGETVHVAVPADDHGSLVLEVFDEDFVTCPKCGRRTEMGELPVKRMQIHVCHRCDHSFIAVPDDDEDGEDETLAKHQPCGCVVCTCEDEVQCQGCGAKHCGTHPVGQLPQPVFNGPGADVTDDLATRAAEVIADIGFTAGYMHVQGQIQFSDSRELMSDIVKWAYDFEAAFDSDLHGDDYMGLIDEFASHHLLGQHDQAEAMLAKMRAGEEVMV